MKTTQARLSGLQHFIFFLTLIVLLGSIGSASARFEIDVPPGGGGARTVESSFIQRDTKAGTDAWIKVTLKVTIYGTTTKTYLYGYSTEQYEYSWFAKKFLGYNLSAVILSSGQPAKGIVDVDGGKKAFYEAALVLPGNKINFLTAYVQFDESSETFKGWGEEEYHGG